MDIRKLAQAGAQFNSAAFLAWSPLTYVKHRTTRQGMMWLLPKLSAGTFSPRVAAVGLLGMVVGTLSGIASVTASYALVALAAGIPVLRTWLTPEVITDAFAAIDMRSRLRSVSVQAAVLMLPYADHGFDLMGTNWSPSARQALWHAEGFLAFVAGPVASGPCRRKRLDDHDARRQAGGASTHDWRLATRLTAARRMCDLCCR